ncbi:MAG TPA: hypothetical protein VHE12_02290 [bacterium]|nr:hypothetical protein [bacterium]
MKMLSIFLLMFFSLILDRSFCQQQDVPEPVFVNFSITVPYVPTYKGRDPFVPLDNMDRPTQISIADLEFHGTIVMNGETYGLFAWKGNPSIRYTLKSRRLYSDSNELIDGVIGDITDSKVILIQGDQKVACSRER